MFALISKSTLYFKVDDSNLAAYEQAGSQRFKPMPYEVPADVFEDTDKLTDWARTSIAVAHALAAKKNDASLPFQYGDKGAISNAIPPGTQRIQGKGTRFISPRIAALSKQEVIFFRRFVLSPESISALFPDIRGTGRQIFFPDEVPRRGQQRGEILTRKTGHTPAGQTT